MLVVHDGTANINKRNVNNVKCVNCGHCKGFENGYYLCEILPWELELVEECIANDNSMDCDFYVEDRDDNFTKRA